ncbi:MAG: DUF456 domain-containing protein [Cyclobacteriaceae bacterium]|nr:DUF456 domain-containing protein [Cyclobacteriaceae bacterium]
MEVIIIIFGGVLILAGLAGCFLPVLPGPPLAYVSLWLLQINDPAPFTIRFLLIMAAVVVSVTVLDYLIPGWGARRWGGSKYGIYGAMLGVLAGLFIFPPFGFLIFPIVGAVAGEMLGGIKFKLALKAGLGAFAGLMMGTLLKFSVTLVIAYYFIINI